MRNDLLALGVIILIVGIGLSVYYQSHTVFGVEVLRTYPYRDVGMLLILGGILCSIIGFVYNPKKETVAPIQQSS